MAGKRRDAIVGSYQAEVNHDRSSSLLILRHALVLSAFFSTCGNSPLPGVRFLRTGGGASASATSWPRSATASFKTSAGPEPRWRPNAASRFGRHEVVGSCNVGALFDHSTLG